MDFKDYLDQQHILHPSLQPQDIAKLCYQAAKGAEHLLSDIHIAKQYFDLEYDKTPSLPETALYEEISSDVCRVNLGAWKASDLPSEWLFRMFTNSASIAMQEDSLLESYLAEADHFVKKTKSINFSYEEWKTYLTQYKRNDMPSVHHSEIYRTAEQPAYRIVHKRFIKLLPVLIKASAFIENLPENPVLSIEMKHPVCIAIDGRAASGKSTMAADLNAVLCGGLVHIDDFFLPPSLRNEARLSEIGGNVHYERFYTEVLPLLSQNNAFTYRTFDCRKMDYGANRTVKASNWRIVEGAYSHHPYFGTYADIKVFSDIDSHTQRKRILLRNGEKMAERFEREWIPMEETYYTYYQIKENSDIVLSD